MRWYFAACIYLEQDKGREEYDEYVRLVRPIVEHYGGEYMVRTEAVEALGALWKPDRMIIIRFPDRRSLDTCFGSEEYKGIMCKRISSVDSRAVIVPEFEDGGRIVKISDTVYQLKDEFQITPEISRYVYVYLIEGKEGYYLIDSGVKGCHKKIGDYIHKIGRLRQTINAVLLTHSHPDHMGAAKAIKEQYGGLVYACEGEQNWIENIDVQFRERPIPNFYRLIEGSVAVDKVVRHGDVIALEPGVTLEVINSSGHSKESLSYYYREEGVLFTGDGIPVPGDIPIFKRSVLSDILRLKTS